VYLTSWDNSIFDYKLRAMRLKILKKLRTASQPQLKVYWFL